MDPYNGFPGGERVNQHMTPHIPPMNPQMVNPPHHFPPFYYPPRVPIMFNPQSGTFMVGGPQNMASNMFQPPSSPAPSPMMNAPNGDHQQIRQIENYLFGILKKDNLPETTPTPTEQPENFASLPTSVKDARQNEEPTPVSTPQKQSARKETHSTFLQDKLNTISVLQIPSSPLKINEQQSPVRKSKPAQQPLHLDESTPQKIQSSGPPMWMSNDFEGTYLDILSAQVFLLHQFLEPDMGKFQQRREKLLNTLQNIVERTFPGMFIHLIFLTFFRC
jgi:hypothetical protein